jgi:hypothetical protein
MQGQPQYGQQGPQSSYQQQYGQDPAAPIKMNFPVTHAKVPGALLLLSAGLNLAFLITVAAKFGWHLIWNDVIAAVVFYSITGGLALFCTGSQRSRGPAIALIILAAMTLFTCLTQVRFFKILHPP